MAYAKNFRMTIAFPCINDFPIQHMKTYDVTSLEKRFAELRDKEEDHNSVMYSTWRELHCIMVILKQSNFSSISFNPRKRTIKLTVSFSSSEKLMNFERNLKLNRILGDFWEKFQAFQAVCQKLGR